MPRFTVSELSALVLMALWASNASMMALACSRSMWEGLRGGQSAGDGVGDDGLALLFRQLHQPPLFRHQFINLPRFLLQEGGDGGLLGEGWATGKVTEVALFLARECSIR
jgi:hypothetical protein